MLILFDHSTPAPLRRHLDGHEVREAFELGWDRLSNGELLAQAEQEGFDVMITADKNIRYQQNLTGRKIALVVLSNAQWPILRLHVSRVVEAANACTPGSYVEVAIPFDAPRAC
jgi:hypothetical protein